MTEDIGIVVCGDARLSAKSLPNVTDPGEIEGLLAVYESVDLTNESFARGCFARSIATNVRAGTVKLMAKHFRDGGDVADVIGTIVEAREDDAGLWIRAKLSNAALAQDVRGKIMEGHIKGLSVGYRVLRSYKNADGVRVLAECELLEGTVTVKPVNPGARIISAKSRSEQRTVDTAADVARRRARLTQLTEDAKTMDRIQVFKRYVMEGKKLADIEGGKTLRSANVTFDQIDGAAIPDEVSRVVQAALFGKTLIAASGSGATAVNTSYHPAAQGNAIERARLLPLCQTVRTVGTLQWPRATQADAGAEGAADEFAEFGYMACEWGAEGSEPAGPDLRVEQISIRPFLLAGWQESSMALVSRAGENLAAMITGICAGAFGNKIEKAVLNGDGTDRPLGVLQAAGVREVNRAGAGAVVYGDLVNLEDALPAWLQARGAWVIAKGAMKSLKSQTDDTGRPLVSWDTAGTPMILGHPVVVTDVTTLGTAGDVIFGDWSFYVLAVEEEMVLHSSAHFKFKAARICYRPAMSVGGKPVAPRAFVKLTDPA